jgi:hypothetical protein
MSFIAPNDMQPYHGFAVAWIWIGHVRGGFYKAI